MKDCNFFLKNVNFVALQIWKQKKAVFTDKAFFCPLYAEKTIQINWKQSDFYLTTFLFLNFALEMYNISHSCISIVHGIMTADKQEVNMDAGNLIERDLEATLMPLAVTGDWLEDDNETIRNQFQQPDWQVGGVSVKKRGRNDWMNVWASAPSVPEGLSLFWLGVTFVGIIVNSKTANKWVFNCWKCSPAPLLS